MRIKKTKAVKAPKVKVDHTPPGVNVRLEKFLALLKSCDDPVKREQYQWWIDRELGKNPPLPESMR